MAAIKFTRSMVKLVEVHRPSIEPAPHQLGYVVGLTAEVVLIQRMEEGYVLGGYSAFARETVDELSEDVRHRDVLEASLRLKRQRPRIPRGIDVSSMRAAVTSANDRYDLVVLHRERLEPDMCDVGRLRLTTARTYVLDPLTPDAVWVDDRRRNRFADLTRVDFGNAYEQTLAAVARSWGHPRPRRRGPAD